jgi:hypothetical protein
MIISDDSREEEMIISDDSREEEMVISDDSREEEMIISDDSREEEMVISDDSLPACCDHKYLLRTHASLPVPLPGEETPQQAVVRVHHLPSRGWWRASWAAGC